MPISSSSLLGFVLLSIIYYRWAITRTQKPLPPGPKRLPLIGSLLNILPSRLGLAPPNPKPLFQQFLEIGKQCNSDIIHIDVLGDHTVVLNSVKAVTELLDHRNSNYSDRPEMHMVDGLMGWDWDLAHMPYSDTWRRHRRTFQHYFQPRAVAEYHPIQRKAVTELLHKLLATPEPEPLALEGYIRHHAGTIILRVTYGITSPEDKDFYVDLANRAITPIVQAGNHGTYLVDYFPLLKYVPAWFPGADFKRKAQVWSHYSSELRDLPWEKVQSEITSGTALDCFVTKNIEAIDTGSESTQDVIEVIKNCAGVAYLAGSDTSVSLMYSAVLALLTHPEVQERAQTELDSVLGTGKNARLPDYTDREDLPYLSAIVSETLRMYPITPLALPHHSLEDDIYEGYYIPKGSTVVGNSWAVLHDEQLYPDPMTYNPSRFLKHKATDSDEEIQPQPNPAMYAFGFGRRICPGRWLALDTAWLVISCILATCTIKKALDSEGKEIEPVTDYGEDGLVNHPRPYNCRFVPRSDAALKLMKNGFLTEED